MQTEEITFELKDERTKDIRVYCFVCTGNTCRSPMAEAVLNYYGASHGIFAFSRGVCADVGAPISENAAKALAEDGIPSEGRNEYLRHRAMQFQKEDFERCDGVFAISPSHAQALIMAFPEYAGKVRVLGDISDPYGGDLERYKACLRDIKDALKSAFPYIFEDEN
ncbi:MAG: low molecular weight protein arginine phosphatase [Clostridia bacterium]|nr:low molecular weight protein arginine phosphatase [Clostridia bacterium]